MSQTSRELAGSTTRHVVPSLGRDRTQLSRWRKLRRIARQQPLGTVSALIILILIVMAAFPELVATHDPLEAFAGDELFPPSTYYWLGTDNIGRDMFSRIVWGARTSLWVGILSVGLGTSVGTLFGMVSGYFEGRIDMVLQRIMDSFMAFPPLILALAMIAVLGQSTTNLMFAISVGIAPWASRIIRGSTLSVKHEAYVEAARAAGASHGRILWRHILPNIAAPIIVIVSITLGYAILVEAALSFIGLGAPPPAPSWGRMLSGDGRRFMEHAPWLAIAPGLAISISVLAFNLLGDALRDVLDPSLKNVSR
jgi:ABC-type dipeptide/oligopeptide/nickel transport system permease subunit